MQRLTSFVCKEGGSELVEFGIAAGIFFAILIGAFELCLAIYAGGFVAYAAQQGTRYAMVRGSDWTTACASASSFGCKASAANVQNYILSLPHPGLNLTANNITFTPLSATATGAACTPYAQGCQVEVKVSYSFSLSIPFFPAASVPLSSSSIETIQN